MRRQIIIGTLILVNALQAPAYAISVKKKKIGPVVDWLSRTGKDREDFNDESATLVDRKPGNAQSKARGAPAKEGGPDRFVYLFFKNNGKADFIAVQQLERTGKNLKETGYKVLLNGKIKRGWIFKADLDESGKAIPSTGETTDLKITKDSRKLVESDLDFWLNRAKQDAQKHEAPNR